MSSFRLPPFLQPISKTDKPASPYIETFFEHESPLGHAHCLWWPSQSGDPETVVLFVPGNPGLAKFYVPFLSALHSHPKIQNVAILAQSLLGHTASVFSGGESGLLAQVQSVIEAISAVKESYASARIVLIGHSVGAWISLQAFKQRVEDVESLFLLFPTISQIGRSPNGRRLQWAFQPPFPSIISKLSFLLRLLPSAFLSLVFSDWPQEQVQVLQELLDSPRSILSCLSMAHEEMNTIRQLEVDILVEHKDRFHFYFADHDDWVGEEKNTILRCFEDDSHSVKIIHGRHGVPHAFCINHGEELAEQCVDWMS
ncbi:alpha/beta-hydrolase [Dendrothele bispora CBS 962.96]|uniref:Alpha/beta-hydrolase n=1 Tax=Dendrothele bispora (strain CBS 962.96) TaxID=1314807 RepID=A0A4S8MUD2_DENBC|nr:alpha/beta-hydrolase [Dendrothele bispora CBS 962.96]